VKLKALQDTLARMGKSLIVVFAPDKAAYYPAHFPAKWENAKKGITNFEAYRHVADSLGINYVDMNTWFLSMKNKTHDSLFAKQGIHWTIYGAMLAGDSLMRYIEKLRNIHLNHPYWTQVVHTTKARDGDDDVAKELNLVFPAATETFSYPVVQYPDNPVRPGIIYIGDSYGYKMVLFGVVAKMNSLCEYWGYFDEVHGINEKKFTYIKDYDWKAAINKTDCIVLAYTSFNLPQLGNGFIEKAYDYYYPERSVK
jgi:hypothetical protein